MYEKVKATIARYGMISAGDKVVVGVSGGPDSTALAHVLARIAGDEGFSLHIGHLNHMFRGEEADLDALSVASFAEELGVPYTVEKKDVPAYLRENKMSAQRGARHFRYAFFEELSRAVGANKMATGHTADDQAETIIMNLLRGSGLAGLSGIPPVRNNFFIRPLIEVTRREIEAYCNDFNLPVRFDTSNDKDIYLRNKIRHQLMPYLRDHFNPNLVETLLRLSGIVRDDDRYISERAGEAWDSLVQQHSLSEIAFDLNNFFALPVALRRRIVLEAWKRINGSERDIAHTHVEQMLDFCARPGTGWLELPRGFRVRKQYDKVIFQRGGKEEVISFEYTLAVPGITRIPEAGVVVETELVNKDRQQQEADFFVDYDLLPGVLKARSRRPGDKFRPLGLGGSKKLKDYLIDLKIPAEERDRLPIIVAGDEVVCVGTLRMDERWKTSRSTHSILGIKIIHEIQT